MDGMVVAGRWTEIGQVTDIPRQGARVVASSIGDIAVFRALDDAVFATLDHCPHKGGPLSQGIVHGHAVTCPLHNWVIDLQSGEVYLQARRMETTAGERPAAAIATQGQTVDLGGIRVQFVREGRFALLQIARNPGIPIFLMAAILLVGGLAITFYFPHRRVRAIVTPVSAGSEALLAPLAKRDWSGQRDFHIPFRRNRSNDLDAFTRDHERRNLITGCEVFHRGLVGLKRILKLGNKRRSKTLRAAACGVLRLNAPEQQTNLTLTPRDLAAVAIGELRSTLAAPFIFEIRVRAVPIQLFDELQELLPIIIL